MLCPTLILLFIMQFCVGQLSFVNYKDIHFSIGSVPYTTEQRIQVAQSVKNMLSVVDPNKIYVNRQSKVENYRNSYYEIDPLPKIDKIIKESAKMRDIDFHYAFVDIFMSLRDFHTSYELPGPHRCVENHKAISFDIVGWGDNAIVVVSGYSDERIRKLSPSAKPIRLGDELVSISKISVKDHIKVSNFTKGGANDSGALRAALRSFSKVSGRINKLPRPMTESYQFKTVEGTFYEVRLPWISVVDSECWIQSKMFATSGQSNTLFLPSPQEIIRSAIVSDPSFNQEIRLPASEEEVSPINIQESQFVKWTTFKHKSKKLGIITLHTFKPLENDIQKAVFIIRELLLVTFKDTDAILFDVRSNLGGIIQLADLIPQLFGIDIKTGSFRAIASQTNKDLVSRDTDWFKAFGYAKQGNAYTPLVKISSNELANRIGQVYSKPVGVLTNGVCYSACEIFAANLKDNNLATIFGEDNTTGGGGAIVIDYNTHLSLIQPFYFPRNPFMDKIPLGAQNFKVAWKQFVRIDGRLIEDNGVRSDYIVRPTRGDFLEMSNTATQYKRISDILFQQGVDTGKDKLNFQIYPKHYQITCEIGDTLEIQFMTTGFKSVLILDEFGRVIQTTVTRHLLNNSNARFLLDSTKKSANIERLNFRGFDFAGKLVFSTWKAIRFTPKPKSFLQINQSMNFDLNTSADYVGFYDTSRSGAEWIKSDNGLTIAEGRDIESVLSYFLHFNADDNLVSIKGYYKTQKSRDYFRIGYKLNNKSVYLLESGGADKSRTLDKSDSGVVLFDNAYQIPAGDVELFFRFKGDVSSISGATINAINVF